MSQGPERDENSQQLRDLAHHDLEDPSRAHWTITAIALAHGFHDPSYFGRAFKARYDVTPSQHRRVATAS